MALVRIERRGETALLVAARPPVNAIDLAVARELHARLDELAAQVPAGGVVVTGEGGTFSSGVDFKAVPAYSEDERRRMIGHINAAVALLYGLPTATVAAVNGHAIGGAFVVMLACDVRLAADVSAKLGLTEVTMGIPYPACPMEVVKAELDPTVRRQLVLSGELVSPRVAHARGVIDELTPPEQLLARAVEVARARAAAPAYARVKEQLRGEVLARMRATVAGSDDPMLQRWV